LAEPRFSFRDTEKSEDTEYNLQTVILQARFQNVGTVVAEVIKGSKKSNLKKGTKLWTMAEEGFENKRKVKIQKKILMETEQAISVKSGRLYTHTQIWRHPSHGLWNK
jgi:hypothetical protein